MKNSWNKVVALMLAAALCVSCGVTGFAEDTQTDENTEIVEVVEQQMQEESPKEEAPAQEEPKAEPAPAPVQEEPKAEPAPAPVQEEPKAEPAPAPVTEEPKAEPAPEAPKAEEPKAEPAPEAPKAEEPKQEEETKADEKTEEKIEEKAAAPEQKVEESAEQKTEDVKADETKKEEEIKAETQIEESKEESKTEEPKTEEKPAEQPTVPAATKVEQPLEEAPAADEVKKENITVRIEWEDEDNALGLRPQTRAVTLNGSDGQTYSATLAEKDGWQHTFADLTTQRGAEVIYYSVDADDVTDYDKDVRGLTVTYTCTAQPVVDEQPAAEEEPIIDEEPAAEDENLIDDQMDGEQGELPEGGLPTITETEDGTVIDMGETAEEPVEGEEANADKPEEDGELDEDFTLPEEGELPEEDAEPEIPEIDFSTLQVVIGEPQYDEDVMTLRATLIGFDNIDYALQWQFSTDDATWTDVSGATGDTLVVQLDESNAGCYWRVSAEVFGWKTLPTEQAAQE